jgi:hypothetical protein
MAFREAASMSAFTVAQLLVRILGLVLVALGIGVMVTHDVALASVYASAAVALMLGLWTLAWLAARSGVHSAGVVLTVVLGLAPVVISVTGEWVLYAVAGVAALVQSEDLGLRIERRRLAGATD